MIYDNPPIQEALFGITFTSSKTADQNLPFLFWRYQYAKLSLEADASSEQSEDEANEKTGYSFRFANADRTLIVQLIPGTMIINVLKPYFGWARFKEVIQICLEAYSTAANPTEAETMALRYVNRIVIPETEDKGKPIVLAKFLNLRPVFPSKLVNNQPSNFKQTIDLKTPDGILDVRLTSLSGSAGSPALLLDLALSRPLAGGNDTESRYSLDSVPAWLETAHEAIKSAFHACVTAEAERGFGRRDDV